MQITIAVGQIDIELFDEKANLERIEQVVARARQESAADLVVLPELANIGYIKGRDKHFGEKYIGAASKLGGEFTGGLGELARQYDVHICAGMAELHPTVPGTLYNSAVVLTPNGKIAGVHRKAHIPGYEKHYFVPANTNDVIRTDIGALGVGICYDNQFAELTRTFALKGAEILVMLWNMPSFSNGGSILHNLTSVRAFENRMFAVSANRVGTCHGMEFFGHSAIANPLGELLAAAQDGDELLVGALDRNELIRERAQMTIFRDRRPDLYEELAVAL